MSKSYINNKTQQVNARFPHDVLEQIEAVKLDGETTAGFLVAAARGEITRRQLKESGEDKLLSNLNSALETLSKIEQAGALASESLLGIVSAAQSEIKQLQGKQVSTPSNELILPANSGHETK